MSRSSDTQKYTLVSKSSTRKQTFRPRKRRGKQIFLGVTVVLLLLIVAVALFFIIRDLVTREKPDLPADGTGTTAATEDDRPELHGASLAIDGDDSTYMLSGTNQTVGSYLNVELAQKTDIMTVEVITNHAVRYIRHADVQISTDGQEWSTFGEFSGNPSDPSPKTVTKGSAVPAAFVRIVITEKASEKWVLNSVRVLDADGIAVPVRDAISGFVDADITITKAPEVSTQIADGDNTVTLPNADIHIGDLVLVNTKHEFVFPSSTADILPMYSNRTEVTLADGTKVQPFSVGGSALPAMRASALVAFNRMTGDFCKVLGKQILHVGENDAYRSYETQAELARKYPTSASAAGLSDHNTGLSANISIRDGAGYYQLNDTASPLCAQALTWLTANAWQYGFIERFPAEKKAVTGVTDNFHYRYVGVPHAYYMSKNNLCLEEYAELLRDHTLAKGSLTVTTDQNERYSVYYVPMASGQSTAIPVPADAPYTVSGDNIGGFIVTVSRN